jgi:hypothetical protein
MLAYFGKEFEYKVYALSTDDKSKHKLPTAHNGIYLYAEKPTLTEAASGAGSPIFTIAAGNWADTTDGLGKKFTITRVSDPEPNTPNFQKTYYLAINTKTEASDTTPHTPIMREILFTRLRVQEGAIQVSPQDLVRLQPKLKMLCGCLGDLDSYILSAIYEVKSIFNNYTFKFEDIWNPEPLNIVIAHKALAMFFTGKGQGTVEYNLMQMHIESYKTHLKNLDFYIIDKQREGSPQTVSSRKNNSIRFAP